MDDKLKVKLSDVNPDQAKKFAQRLHRKKDDIEITRKSAIAEVSESSDDDRTITARVSTPDRDRDGEVVEPKGIDLTHFNANPVLMWAHEYKKPPIGRAMWSRVDDRGLLCKFEFAKTAFADEIYTLYRDGFLKTFSIGFIPIEFDGKTKTHKRASLLEVSACPIPSDPFALIEASAKGLVLCDSLKHDLGLDAVGDTDGDIPEDLDDADAVIPPGKAVDTAGDIPDSETVAESGIDVETSTETKQKSASVTEPESDTSTETNEEPSAETKAALPDVTVALAPDQIAAALIALNERLAGIEARLAPPQPGSVAVVEPPSPADFIALDPEPDILVGLSLTPAPVPVPAPKSIETMTEDQIIEAVGKAVANLDLRSLLKELVDLSLDKLRGRVR